MILELNEPKINHLKKNTFAIPKLNWGEEYEHLNGYRFTVKARVTAMRKNGYGKIISDFFKIDPTTPNEIEPVIRKLISKNNIENSTELLEIYHLIQLWGGNSSRRYYGEYVSSFNVNNYKELIKVGVNKESKIDEIIEASKTFSKNTLGINISFITKHIRFWQKEFNFKNPLPIYDEIMARYTMGVKNTNNRWDDLRFYWNNMVELACEIKEERNFDNFSTWELERQLFVFFQNDPENNGWRRPGLNINIRTSEHLSKNPITRTNKESKNKKVNIIQKKTQKSNDIKPPFYLHKTNTYKAILINQETSKKVGYITASGYLHASVKLKNLLVNHFPEWEDAINDAGSKEKWKCKFASEEACIESLKSKGILQNV